MTLHSDVRHSRFVYAPMPRPSANHPWCCQYVLFWPISRQHDSAAFPEQVPFADEGRHTKGAGVAGSGTTGNRCPGTPCRQSVSVRHCENMPHAASRRGPGSDEARSMHAEPGLSVATATAARLRVERNLSSGGRRAPRDGVVRQDASAAIRATAGYARSRCHSNLPPPGRLPRRSLGPRRQTPPATPALLRGRCDRC